MKTKMDGFEVENTGGGCQWLRKGNIAITDGECGLPQDGKPCTVYGLNETGSVDCVGGQEFPSLEAGLAFVRSCKRIYGE